MKDNPDFNWPKNGEMYINNFMVSFAMITQNDRDILPECMDKRIYKKEMKFWAVLGSRGCREKKTSQLPLVSNFLGWFFQLFVGKRKLKTF